MKIVKLFLVLATAALIAGCSAQKPSGSTGKMQINDIWVLVKTGSKDVAKVTGRSQPMIEIHVAEGRFIGNTGCNEMSGNVEVGDKSIKFSEITSTKMFCDDSPETEYLAALKKVDNWEYGKLTLYLKSGNDVLLTFKKVD